MIPISHIIDIIVHILVCIIVFNFAFINYAFFNKIIYNTKNSRILYSFYLLLCFYICCLILNYFVYLLLHHKMHFMHFYWICFWVFFLSYSNSPTICFNCSICSAESFFLPSNAANSLSAEHVQYLVRILQLYQNLKRYKMV